MQLVKTRSYWIRVNPKSSKSCPYKKAMWRHRPTQRGEHHVKMEAKIRKMELQAKESKDFQQPPGARKSQGRLLPFRRSTTLPTP